MTSLVSDEYCKFNPDEIMNGRPCSICGWVGKKNAETVASTDVKSATAETVASTDVKSATVASTDVKSATVASTDVKSATVASTDVKSATAETVASTNYTKLALAFKKSTVSDELAKKEEEDCTKYANYQPPDDPELREKMLEKWKSEFLKNTSGPDKSSNWRWYRRGHVSFDEWYAKKITGRPVYSQKVMKEVHRVMGL
jgi:hypothetical protein